MVCGNHMEIHCQQEMQEIGVDNDATIFWCEFCGIVKNKTWEAPKKPYINRLEKSNVNEIIGMVDSRIVERQKFQVYAKLLLINKFLKWLIHNGFEIVRDGQVVSVSDIERELNE